MQKRKSYENDLILKQNNKKLRKKILEFLSIQVHQITVCIVHRKGTFSSFLLPKLLNWHIRNCCTTDDSLLNWPERLRTQSLGEKSFNGICKSSINHLKWSFLDLYRNLNVIRNHKNRLQRKLQPKSYCPPNELHRHLGN
jgi:hypothetical protein